MMHRNQRGEEPRTHVESPVGESPDRPSNLLSDQDDHRRARSCPCPCPCTREPLPQGKVEWRVSCAQEKGSSPVPSQVLFPGMSRRAFACPVVTLHCGNRIDNCLPLGPAFRRALPPHCNEEKCLWHRETNVWTAFPGISIHPCQALPLAWLAHC